MQLRGIQSIGRRIVDAMRRSGEPLNLTECLSILKCKAFNGDRIACDMAFDDVLDYAKSAKNLSEADIRLIITDLDYEDFNCQYFALTVFEQNSSGLKDAEPALIQILRSKSVSLHGRALKLVEKSTWVGDERLQQVAKTVMNNPRAYCMTRIHAFWLYTSGKGRRELRRDDFSS